MKKLFNLFFALIISASAFAQGYNVQVCVTISGPNPTGPVVANLTYFANGVNNTISDTLLIMQLPYTHCFQSYALLPDTSFFAYANGFVQLSTCAPTIIYNYAQMITSNTTISVSAQNCSNTPTCSASLSQIPGTTLLTASGTGVAPLSYSWDGGITFSSNSQITMNGPGTYCVSVMDAMGCTATDCFTYSGTPSCQAVIDIQGNGPYNLTAIGNGIPPLTYYWSTGATSQSIVASSSGNYCLLITDSTGCTDTTCVYLTVGSGNCSTYIVESSNPNGVNVLTAIIDSTFSGVASYSWTLNGAPVSGLATAQITPTTPGLYCVTVDYNNGCTASNCYQYNPGNPIGGCSVYTAAIQDSINPNMYYLMAYPTGTPPFTYTWMFSNGTTSTSSSPSTIFINNSSVNWAVVTITDATGCVSSYSTIIPNIPPAGSCYSNFSSFSNYQFGNAGEVFFQSYAQNGLPANITYLWDFGDGSTSTLENPSHTYASTGFYNVCLTTTYNGCSYTSCQSEYVDLAWWTTNPYQGNCTAGFMILTNGSIPGGFINIINTSQGNNLFYTWSFGNGFISNNPLPFTTINNPGVYEICVSILDTVNMCSDTFCDTITIDSLGNVYRSAMSGNVGILVSGSPQPNALLTTVDIRDNAENITLIPNPSNGIVAMTANWIQGSSTVELIDIAGNVVKSQSINTTKGQQSVTLDLQGIADGSYLVRVVSDQRVQTVKLLVNH